MILKFVIKCIKMSIERIVTAQPTSDISGTFNMWVKCQHGRKWKLPNVSFLILTFILLIWTPHPLASDISIVKKVEESSSHWCSSKCYNPCVSLYQLAIATRMLCNKPLQPGCLKSLIKVSVGQVGFAWSRLGSVMFGSILQVGSIFVPRVSHSFDQWLPKACSCGSGTYARKMNGNIWHIVRCNLGIGTLSCLLALAKVKHSAKPDINDEGKGNLFSSSINVEINNRVVVRIRVSVCNCYHGKLTIIFTQSNMWPFHSSIFY